MSVGERNSDDAWLAVEAEAVKRRIIQEGVAEDRAEDLKDDYVERVKKGVPPKYAERHLLPDVLQAKREGEVDGLARALAQQYHLTEEVVEKLIARDLRRLRENPKLLIKLIAQKHAPALQRLSSAAYSGRRAAQSPMAQALVRAKLVKVPRAE